MKSAEKSNLRESPDSAKPDTEPTDAELKRWLAEGYKNDWLSPDNPPDSDSALVDCPLGCGASTNDVVSHIQYHHPEATSEAED